jgi:hypothetical protein
VASLWPWLVVAGAGVLHGLNPATGWLLAAGCGLRSGDRHRTLRALAPIAAGHALSIASVATAVTLGLTIDEWRRPVMGAAVVLVVALCFRGRARRPRRGHATGTSTSAGGVALGLWSFVVSTAHGSGMMLVPALVPLCLGDSPAREITATGSLALALAAVALHMLAMLGTLGLVAAGAVRAVTVLRRACARTFDVGSTKRSE